MPASHLLLEMENCLCFQFQLTSSLPVWRVQECDVEVMCVLTFAACTAAAAVWLEGVPAGGPPQPAAAHVERQYARATVAGRQ